MGLSLAEIEENYFKVKETINHETLVAGRPAESVKLIVVTKGHPFEVVQKAIEIGIAFLGENYVEEAKEKIVAAQGETAVEWHMIGHIQSRKARQASELFDWVHSLDSVKLAKRLNRFAEERDRKLPVLLECNVSGEMSKFGWKAWEGDRWEDLIPEFTEIATLSNLEIKGLMTMAPFFPRDELTRPYFKNLRQLKDFLTTHIPEADWTELSMGMSSDYKVAIQEGSTLVRVGTAILGQRG